MYASGSEIAALINRQVHRYKGMGFTFFIYLATGLFVTPMCHVWRQL